VTDEREKVAAQRYIEAGRVSAAEARKTGTPEYDPRAHERAVEHERKMADELDKIKAGKLT